jgi:hypothetical protein
MGTHSGGSSTNKPATMRAGDVEAYIGLRAGPDGAVCFLASGCAEHCGAVVVLGKGDFAKAGRGNR